MPIPQISTANTFGQWVISTQNLIDGYNTLSITTANLVNSAANVTSGGSNVAIVNETTNNVRYITFTANVSGNIQTLGVTSSKLYFNPSTGAFTSTEINSLSDETRKYNIETIQRPLDTVQKLRGVTFNWRDTNLKSIGLIAQEIEQILPEVVSDNDGVKSVSYGNIVGLLIEAIKEQQKEIEQLKVILDGM